MSENGNISEVLAGVLESLSEEQKAKAKECKTAEELLQLAASEGIELPDEMLDKVAGGFFPTAEEYHERFEGTEGYLPDVYEELTGKSC